MERRKTIKQKAAPAQTALSKKAAALKARTAAPALSPKLAAANTKYRLEAGLAVAVPSHDHDCEHVHAARAPPSARFSDKAEAMAKRPARTKTTQRARFRGLQSGAFTISSFCVAHDLSESFYHKLRNRGLGPREMRIGARVLISHEAASNWRKAREKATLRAKPSPSLEAAE